MKLEEAKTLMDEQKEQARRKANRERYAAKMKHLAELANNPPKGFGRSGALPETAQEIMSQIRSKQEEMKYLNPEDYTGDSSVTLTGFGGHAGIDKYGNRIGGSR